MAALEVTRTARFATAGPASSAQPSVDARRAAVPTAAAGGQASGAGVDVHRIGADGALEARLGGHASAATAACLCSVEGEDAVVTAADGELLFWRLCGRGERCVRLDNPPPDVAPEGISAVRHVSAHGGRCCSATGRAVCVHALATGRVEWWLEGHSATVTATAFAPQRDGCVVSVSEDRTFVVWDVEQGSAVFTSQVEAPLPFVAVAVDPALDRFAAGSVDGVVRFFSLHDFKLQHVFEFAAERARRRRDAKSPVDDGGDGAKRGSIVVTARRAGGIPAAAANAANAGSGPDDSASGDSADGGMLLQLAFFPRVSGGGGDDAGKGGGGAAKGVAAVLSDSEVFLAVATTSSIGVVDTCAMRLVDVATLGSQDSAGADAPAPVAVAGAVAFGPAGENALRALVCGAFERAVDLCVLRVLGTQRPVGDAKPLAHSSSSSSLSLSLSPAFAAGTGLSMLSDSPLLPDSPLHATLSLAKAKPATPGSKAGGRGSVAARTSGGSMSGATTNSPVTFGRKIKSSGYAAPSKSRAMFQPQTNFCGKRGSRGGSQGGRASSASAKAGGGNVGIDPERLTRRSGGGGGGGETRQATYPTDSGPPSVCAGRFAVSAGPPPVALHAVSVGPSGKSVAALSADKGVSVVRLGADLGLSACTTFLGHGSAAVTAAWSADSRHLVTASRDDAMVWDLGTKSREPTLALRNRLHNFKPKEGEDAAANAPFAKGDVVGAQFFFVDKFLLVGHGAGLSLYKFALDATPPDDLNRLKPRSRYREVVRLRHPSAKAVTAFAAPNGFHSYLAVAAGSDRSLSVFDLNRADASLVIPDVQARPVHTVALCRGSRFADDELPADAFNLFLTAAVADGVRLWDVRTGRDVRRFSGHSDRSQPIGVDLSPCGRFVATGSEDRHAYVFDIGGGGCVAKLPGHGDVVAGVGFHPARPGIFTACADGVLREYVPA